MNRYVYPFFNRAPVDWSIITIGSRWKLNSEGEQRNQFIKDINRGTSLLHPFPLQITVTRLEEECQMANGAMKKYYMFNTDSGRDSMLLSEDFRYYDHE